MESRYATHLRQALGLPNGWIAERLNMESVTYVGSTSDWRDVLITRPAKFSHRFRATKVKGKDDPRRPRRADG